MAHSGKSLISVFQEFIASINKLSFWRGGWALGYHSMRFRHFLDISYFPKILSRSATREATRKYHAYK